ncbi:MULTISPECIES: 2-amino-4-hydroxy-6-hydroxymethyldihydropteridine diphosphokinase [unclassified Sphingopyxis]|uniref:2-amino-4-hydroxy-6- hydroxymethyldihydropteridine diphosphokinase n=1 Tax=unclassified Sphingopyxis TaxID=2614943 RepID=UPI00073788D6|nr:MULTISPECIES: 2-amino-4-hydroxy-6-hydroxymethyldihydropteridine diphosphokinase [unclassified Sphingopyxis]KTE38211.1 2-amino-4-hydroxy-6-hydroxymethyldihydropteridine pyrophosphokinase [Sphingopyxis sp. HIX]KTE83792.1 2-amino-4-hydroxy-6-hydroxymethyldihydropteridine pyrophosphokinase [Sphingopyxis sp. HXXIV]
MSDATPLPLYAIGLGSNRRHARFGDPRSVLMAALAALEGEDIEPVDASPIIASDPVGPSRRRYANAVALVASPLPPPEMLERLQAIEADFGRRTGQRWSARTLDLDILLWSGGAWSDAALTIPHPAMAERAFVLGPLRAVAPEWPHPLLGRSVRQLAARLVRAKPVDRRASAH